MQRPDGFPVPLGIPHGCRKPGGLTLTIATADDQNHGAGLAYTVEAGDLRGTRLRAEILGHDRLMPEVKDCLLHGPPLGLHA
jgi:hypothetical protein